MSKILVDEIKVKQPFGYVTPSGEFRQTLEAQNSTEWGQEFKVLQRPFRKDKQKMEVKVQQMVALDEEAFDEVLVKYLRDKIESAEAVGCKYGPHPYVVQAMKVTHDWFAYPDQWYFTSEEMEKSQAKFDKKKAKGGKQ